MKKRRLSSVFTTNYCEGEFQDIEVQVLLRNGLPKFDIIGLPQQLIKEGRDRILSALSHLGIDLPAQKILVNLRPGSIPKQGSHFDLPILAAILRCLGVLPGSEHPRYFWGELGLDGDIRVFEDFLPHCLFASNRPSASLTVNSTEQNLAGLRRYLSSPIVQVEKIEDLFESPKSLASLESRSKIDIDRQLLNQWLHHEENSLWNRLQGSSEQFLLWAMAAHSRHHILMEGPPGCGKSTWAFAMRDLLAPLQIENWHKRIMGSHCPTRNIEDLWRRPFISPHHSSSRAAIVGGGTQQISPGALSQAHLGSLFLDEIAEFSRDVIEALREPLETKQITISRGATQRTLPADTQIIAAMNPCRCGRFGTKKNCRCSTGSFYSYRNRISEPLRDRFHHYTSWKFISLPRPPEWNLREVKARCISLQNHSPIALDDIALPVELSPRRQRIWLETFHSWCLWSGVTRASRVNQKKFEDFLAFFKGEEIG